MARELALARFGGPFFPSSRSSRHLGVERHFRDMHIAAHHFGVASIGLHHVSGFAAA